MKNVIVACGSGVATSQTVASKIQRILEENNVRANVEAVDIKSIESYVKTADVYVSITKSKKDYGIPTIDGIPFLTGMKLEEEKEKLINILK
ncbi:PTS sugar transporter subunit IIB [Corticicoccus populi]|uniref:PTS sugar transporter subunit IIB n=1 Tax=Corticicoccus populi TaxID=1812821 RepID=A0ABW5WYG7_9STAP